MAQRIRAERETQREAKSKREEGESKLFPACSPCGCVCVCAHPLVDGSVCNALPCKGPGSTHLHGTVITPRTESGPRR